MATKILPITPSESTLVHDYHHYHCLMNSFKSPFVAYGVAHR